MNATIDEAHYPAPTKTRPVLARSYVWCDVHGEIHAAKQDFYEEHQTECRRANWRRVYVESNLPREEF